MYLIAAAGDVADDGAGQARIQEHYAVPSSEVDLIRYKTSTDEIETVQNILNVVQAGGYRFTSNIMSRKDGGFAGTVVRGS